MRVVTSVFPLDRLQSRFQATVLPAFLLYANLLMGFAILANGSELRRSAIVKAVQSARPSVVNIHGRKTVRDEVSQFAGAMKQVNGMGTGVVIDERGYIITNYHVVEGVRRIEVTLYNREEVVAELIAHDARTDLAIIKIDEKHHLPVVQMGTSSDLMPGETVIAVGNAFGYEHTVTQGIVSALNRTVQVSDEQEYHNLIQTDASINPGNSGGPLLNIDGEMIAINVAVRVGAQGIGFAIPIDDAVDIAAKLISKHSGGIGQHGVIGKTVLTADHHAKFVVAGLTTNSPASKSTLQVGDVIETVGDRPIGRNLDFERAMLDRKHGEEVVMEVSRSGKQETVSLVVSKTGIGGDLVDRVWQELGLKLEPVDAASVMRLNSRYRGGMQVVSVRADGPAAVQGINRGDILVGMHKWETISMDHIAYVLNHDELQQFQPLRFFVLRGRETLFGQLQVAQHVQSASK